jgi:hypothetical protein
LHDVCDLILLSKDRQAPINPYHHCCIGNLSAIECEIGISANEIECSEPCPLEPDNLRWDKQMSDLPVHTHGDHEQVRVCTRLYGTDLAIEGKLAVDASGTNRR